MRRYYLSLVVLTLVLVLASFVLLWCSPALFLPVMPWLGLYFGAVTALLHYVVVKSMNRSPRAFVQVFLGSTVGMLLLHLAFIATYLMTHLDKGGASLKAFLIAFLVGFVASFAFETAALVRYVNGKRAQQNLK